MLRFTISPTEDMNINSLRIAILNYILSKQLNEDLIIRIEDTKEILEGKDKENLEILNLFSIEYKSFFYQSTNLKYHQKMALQLMTQKKAFACFCSDEKIEELKSGYDGFCENLSDETVLNTNAPFCVRIKKPVDSSSNDIDSFIILRQDKTPKYNYACAIDDIITDISVVIDDEKYLLNAPKQIYIRNSLGYEKEIKYIYLPTILEGQISVKSLIDEGFLPSAIANYLVLLSSETPKEIFSLEEAIEWFKIENVSKENVKFDLNKLKQINKKHIEMLDEMRLSKILGFADSDIGKLGKVLLNEANTINEIREKIQTIFAPKAILIGFEDEFLKIKECLQKAPFFENYENFKNYISKETSLNDERFEKILAYILTGNADILDISTIYSLIKNYIGEIIR